MFLLSVVFKADVRFRVPYRAGGGGVDLGSLPVAGVESIDVYRGAVPARFGGNSLGGVLHLRTRSLGGQRRWRVQSSSGSFGTRQVNMSASMPFRALDLMVLADVNHSDNDFRFFDDNGTTNVSGIPLNLSVTVSVSSSTCKSSNWCWRTIVISSGCSARR